MPAPKGQAPAKSKGIADDASEYEDLARDSSRERSVSKSNIPATGIAEDSDTFEGLISEETTGKARTLQSDWVYQLNGQVFGPVKPRDLLELLYAGAINKDTPIALDGQEFMALHRYGVFRVHLPKVARHQADLAEAKASEERAAKARLSRRIQWTVLAAIVAAGAGYGLYRYIWASKEAAAALEREAKEKKLNDEIDALMASVTIEPPLIPLVDEKADAREAGSKRKRFARFTSGSHGSSSATELSRQEIMSGIASAFPHFKRCIVEQIQRDADSVPEQIVLAFTINNEGEVRDFNLPDRSLRGSQLGSCMGRHLSQVRFRKYKGEVQNVEYPITIGRR
jgi:hypothetical protein